MTDELDTPVDESLLRGDEEGAVENDDAEEQDAATEEVESAEDEATEEAEVAGKDEPRQRDQMIPRSRFDEVYRQAKEHEEEIARLRAQIEAGQAHEKPQDRAKTAEQVDIKALRQEAAQAIYEGDLDRYAELTAQADAEIMKRARLEANADIEVRAAQRMLDETANRLMAEYSFLDDKNGNRDAIEDVVTWRDSYIARGMAPHEALDRAARKVAPLYMEAKAPEPAEPAKDERTPVALKRSIESAAKQPPATGQMGIGQRTEKDTFRPDRIKQSDWERLSSEERNKLLAA